MCEAFQLTHMQGLLHKLRLDGKEIRKWATVICWASGVDQQAMSGRPLRVLQWDLELFLALSSHALPCL